MYGVTLSKPVKEEEAAREGEERGQDAMEATTHQFSYNKVSVPLHVLNAGRLSWK